MCAYISQVSYLRAMPLTIFIATNSFIDTLLKALQSKSYLPYSDISPADSHPTVNPSADNGIPIPIDAIMSSGPPASPRRGQKRGYEDLDNPEMSMAKGPRLGGEFRGQRNGMGGMGGNFGPGAWNGGMGGAQPNQPPRRKTGICRDYFSTFILCSIDLHLLTFWYNCKTKVSAHTVIDVNTITMTAPSYQGKCI